MTKVLLLSHICHCAVKNCVNFLHLKNANFCTNIGIREKMEYKIKKIDQN